MSDKKSTKDILAGIRGGASAPKPAAEESKPETAAPKAAETQAAKPTGGSPLDAIRAGGAAEAAAKPAAGGSPLDAIRAGGAGAAKKPAGGSPLDAIRSGGAAKPAGGSALDAIRAGAGGAKAAPAAAKAASKSAPVDTKAAAGLSAADMIKAARTGVVTADPATGEPVEPKKVALPKKPLAKPAAGKKATQTRRSAFSSIMEFLLSPVVIAWGSLTAATSISGLAMARFMMPNVLVEPPTKFKIGPGTDYGNGTVSTKWKAQFGVWIVNDEIDGQQMIYALSTVCTHLGCTPNWLEGEQKFKCPCHGSGFYKTGINFEGPAPRPLERYGIRLAEDGMLEVDKSVKFQRELGQWEIAASYVPV